MFVALEARTSCFLSKHRTNVRSRCDNERDRRVRKHHAVPGPLTRSRRGGDSRAGYPHMPAQGTLRLAFLMSPPPRVTRYLTIKRPDHPLARKRQIAYVHRIVLYDAIGVGVHACHWCGRELVWNARGLRSLVFDHLDVVTWINTPGKLVPACST